MRRRALATAVAVAALGLGVGCHDGLSAAIAEGGVADAEVVSEPDLGPEIHEPETAPAIATDTGPETRVPDAGPPSDPLAFAPPALVASTTGNSKVPTIAVVAGTVHVAWHDFTTSPPSLYHAERAPGAAAFTAAPLELLAGRAVFPELLAVGDTLHLAFELDDDAGAHVAHATLRDGSWSAATLVMDGAHPHLALDDAGVVHVVAFRDRTPVHARLAGGAWSAPDAIAIADPFVNALDLAVAGTGDGIDLALATSPGETSYDIHHWTWQRLTGWGPMQTVFASVGLASDDLDVARAAGGLRWAWTEQSAADPWDIPVVTLASGESTPRRVTHESGFALSPTLVIPADGHAIVAWATPRDTIALARDPFDRDVEIGGVGATAPRMAVDGVGVTWLVFVGRDASGVQQIWFTRNAD